MKAPTSLRHVRSAGAPTARGGAAEKSAKRQALRTLAAGFTLVELMIALTGGLSFTVFVFMLTRDVSRYFQQQTRSSDATLSSLGGFHRLRADIARAGFLASPNLAKDPNRCPPPIAGNITSGIDSAGWVGNPALQTVAVARVTVGGSSGSTAGNNMLTKNGLDPDQLDLYGSYSGVDQFAVRRAVPLSGRIDLRPDSPSLVRAGYSVSGSQADNEAVLERLFPAGHIVRLVDPLTGKEQYSLLDAGAPVNAATATSPFLQVDEATVPFIAKGTGNTCGVTGFCDQCLVNVVNTVRYELADLSNATTYPRFAFLFSGAESASEGSEFNAGRFDFVRSFVLPDGTVDTASTELVSEFAVDFKVGVVAVTEPTTGEIEVLGEGNADLPKFAGSSTAAGPATTNQGPHFIRALIPRLSVRTSAPDRGAGTMGPVTGLYRVDLATGTGGSSATGNNFARVRTVSATVATRNTRGVLWP